MASPSTPRSSGSKRTAIRGLSITLGTKILKSPLNDESIRERLKEAGFDEESIKRRDKVALITYIANLKTQMKKTLHEMHAESAESKVTAKIKLAEARSMMEDAQKKFIDAEMKMNVAKTLQVEASQLHRVAERKLQEVEVLEDDLSKRINTFKIDCDTKEREIALESVSLSDRMKALQQEHERILDGQALLNQREEHITCRKKLEEIVPNELNLKWAVPSLSYPHFVQLLQFSCYSKAVLSGLVISIGGLQNSLRMTSISALLDYLQVDKAGDFT